jgi:hypothetical protein
LKTAVFDAFVTEAQMEFLSPEARFECLESIKSDFEELLKANKVLVEFGAMPDVERPRLLEASDEFDYSNRVWELVITEDMVSHLPTSQRESLFENLWSSLQWISADWGLDWDLNSKDPTIRESARKTYIELQNSANDEN